MSEVTQWLTSLVDTVSSCMVAHSVSGPMGFRWRDEEGFWDIMVYCTPGEVMGGAEDGAVIIPGFSLDIHALLPAFEEVVSVDWCSQPMGPLDYRGQHISIEGVYQGHQVYLEILAESPEEEEAGFRVDGSRRCGRANHAGTWS